MKNIFIFIIFLAFSIVSCKKMRDAKVEQTENVKAKKMLAGIWLDCDEDNVAFRIKGDTIYYPDSTSQPLYFKIIADTMILEGGNNIVKYPIVKQTPHVFEFKNTNGDIMKYMKSDNPNDILQFSKKQALNINQKITIKRDSVVMYNGNKYHSYIQVNPTTYKVYRSAYNEEGLQVENIYFDNIIHISVYNGATKLYSKDFRKADYKKLVPPQFLRQSILSDIIFDGVTEGGLMYTTQLAIPDSPSCFIVKLCISFNGKLQMSVTK